MQTDTEPTEIQTTQADESPKTPKPRSKKSKRQQKITSKPKTKSAKRTATAKWPKPSKKLGPRGGHPGNGTNRTTKAGVTYHIMSVHMPLPLLAKLDKRAKKEDLGRSSIVVGMLTRLLK